VGKYVERTGPSEKKGRKEGPAFQERGYDFLGEKERCPDFPTRGKWGFFFQRKSAEKKTSRENNAQERLISRKKILQNVLASLLRGGKEGGAPI